MRGVVRGEIMRMKNFLVAMSLVLVLLCLHPAGHAEDAGRLVDLTHRFNADTIYWPTEKGFQFQRLGISQQMG
jgi:hypothetical protein